MHACVCACVCVLPLFNQVQFDWPGPRVFLFACTCVQLSELGQGQKPVTGFEMLRRQNETT